jgi:hypothetical protein
VCLQWLCVGRYSMLPPPSTSTQLVLMMIQTASEQPIAPGPHLPGRRWPGAPQRRPPPGGRSLLRSGWAQSGRWAQRGSRRGRQTRLS